MAGEGESVRSGGQRIIAVERRGEGVDRRAAHQEPLAGAVGHGCEASTAAKGWFTTTLSRAYSHSAACSALALHTATATYRSGAIYRRGHFPDAVRARRAVGYAGAAGHIPTRVKARLGSRTRGAHTGPVWRRRVCDLKEDWREAPACHIRSRVQ